PVMRDFLNQLLKNNRALFLTEISHAFAELADRQKGIEKSRVCSAKPLDSTEQAQVKRELTQTLGKEVDVVFEVEPNLLAGLKIYIGSQVFDNTVLGRLTSMQDQLTKG
ncbi:MAG: ATP synthase F1 subunit delta, partial [Nitrospirota bacterium]|nr:ATP synthase F1 subunit delta [Nitrospirota bacterium]MDX2420218.1 ATP synthase F1 subunit delta [Nitrospirota bacterium]